MPFEFLWLFLSLAFVTLAFPASQSLDASLKLGSVAVEVVRTVVTIGIAHVIEIV